MERVYIGNLLQRFRTFHTSLTPNEKKCYEHLRNVGRTFGFAIIELPEELRNTICCFYLLMRILDTVEDSKSIPDAQKIHICQTFYETIVVDREILPMVDNPACKKLIEDIDCVKIMMETLTEERKRIIIDSLKTCGEGMAEFVLISEIHDMETLDRYCHHVAGIVGIGLGKIFSTYETEYPFLASPTVNVLSNHNGLLLQKTNILRDFQEDSVRGKKFWPYPRDELLTLPTEQGAMAKFILHTLENHLPPTITNLSLVKSQKIFFSCASPSVLAVATLVECYNNPVVFTDKKVKVSMEVMEFIASNLGSPEKFMNLIFHFIDRLKLKITSENTLQTLDNLKEKCRLAFERGATLTSELLSEEGMKK